MDPTITVKSSDIIAKTVEDVWAFVSDPRNEPSWHTDILELKAASDPESGPGTKWILGATWLVTVQFMGRREYEVEITGLEENLRIEITTRTGPMKPISTYSLEPVDGRTRFTRHVEMPLHGLSRLLKPIMQRNMQKRNASFVQNLKHLLENLT